MEDHITRIPIGMKIIDKKNLEQRCLWFKTEECKKYSLNGYKKCDGYQKKYCCSYLPKGK